MEWETIFKIVGAALASIGASSLIILALSSWLGKVWAQRILQQESHKLESELEKTKRELDLVKETTLRFKNDKILAYRAIIDVVARVLASFDTHQMGRLTPEEAATRFDEFNEQRIRVYGYLAMLAPQSVMDAQDALMDHLIRVSHGSIAHNWATIRSLAINLINEIRKDIGIDSNPIEYRGEL